MGKTLTVAAAQTGPVLTRDIAASVQRAIELVDRAASHGTEIICFPELFPSPFFPATLAQDYEGFFIDLPDPAIEPLLARAHQHGMALAKTDGEELLVATLELDDMARAQKSLPWWRDRRPGLYGRLVRS
jgi:predicted amidohydrolase